MLTVGLTGGIASGKSTVARFLAESGAFVIDADRIAFDVVRQGRPAWHRIVAAFGPRILGPDGEIDRARLGDLIFNDPEQKAVLNGIVHPHVFAAMEKELEQVRQKAPDAVAVLDVPLLIEVGMHARLPHVILVYIPAALQIERLMQRNQLSRDAAEARVRAQMPIDEKRRLADIIIDNRGSLAETRRRTLAVYRQLQTEASPIHNPLNP